MNKSGKLCMLATARHFREGDVGVELDIAVVYY